MFSKMQGFLSALLIGVLVAVMVAMPALAATPAAPATGMTAAGAPLPGWVTIEPGMAQWYRFKYSYDNSDKDNEPFQAIVELRKAAPANVIFEVWTPGRLNAPLRDPKLTREEQGALREPVGMGTPMYLDTVWHYEGPSGMQHRHYVDVFDATHLTWAGSARATDAYYIVVKNKGSEPASYQLTISGPTISF
jgi:hypothetical protein